MDTETAFVRDFSIQISSQEVLRLLGAGEQRARMGEKALKIVREAEALGRKLARSQGIYRILEGARLEQFEPLQGKELAGLGLCTIGPELEERVTELMATGHEPEGYVLDAVGSVAAEATADVVNARMCHWATTHDLVATPRFSPGYGGWSLEDQRIIFRLLPAKKIGMSLNSSCMMIPRKSVSFAVIFQEAAVGEESENACQRCGLESCPFRKR